MSVSANLEGTSFSSLIENSKGGVSAETDKSFDLPADLINEGLSKIKGLSKNIVLSVWAIVLMSPVIAIADSVPKGQPNSNTNKPPVSDSVDSVSPSVSLGFSVPGDGQVVSSAEYDPLKDLMQMSPDELYHQDPFNEGKFNVKVDLFKVLSETMKTYPHFRGVYRTMTGVRDKIEGFAEDFHLSGEFDFMSNDDESTDPEKKGGLDKIAKKMRAKRIKSISFKSGEWNTKLGSDGSLKTKIDFKGGGNKRFRIEGEAGKKNKIGFYFRMKF